MIEAAAQLTQALNLLAGLPAAPARDRKELDLQIALGASLIATKGWAVPEVGTTYGRARELCAGEEHVPELLATLSGLFAHHLHWSSKLVALQIAEELLRLAEQTQDRPAQEVGNRSLGVGLLFNGQLRPAMAHFERALALYNPANRTSPVCLAGPDTRVASRLFIALILLFQGYPDRALVCSRKALAEAYGLGHAFTTSQALYLTCWLHQLRGEREIVEERAEMLMTFATEHGLSAWAADGTIQHGWAVAARGAADRGIAQLREGLAAKEGMGVLQHTPSVLGLLAALYLGIKQPCEALKVLTEALVRIDRLEERWFEADLRRLKGEALLGLPSDHSAEAEACFHEALGVARGQGARLLGTTFCDQPLARLWRDQGKHAEAHDLLAPIYGWFTEGFDTPDLQDAKALLYEVS